MKRFSLKTLKDRRLRSDLIETYTSRREIIKSLKLRKNVNISGPAANIRRNGMNLRTESFSLRIKNSFCSQAADRDNLFVNRVVKTWNRMLLSLLNS